MFRNMFGETGSSDFGGAGAQQFFQSSFGSMGGGGGFPGGGGRGGQQQQQPRQQAPRDLYDGAQADVAPLSQTKFPNKSAKHIW